MPEAAVAVIGAGVVGAACARALAERGLAPVVLEKRTRPGGETTERNSGVVHAGLHDPPESLKTRLCLRGNALLYEWCARSGVACRRCGKLVIAVTEAEIQELHEMERRARAAGVPDFELLGSSEVASLEPELPRTRGAFYSGSTGIVDPCELTQSLIAAAERAGATVVCAARVEAIERVPGGYRLETARGPLEAERVVNAAGLHADEVAAFAGIRGYRLYPCRGDYFSLRTRRGFRHLVYPVKPENATGLGIHLTFDLAGRLRLGPDAEYVSSREDYSPREDKRARFAEAARRLLGRVEEGDLEYDTCGIRPKLRAPGDEADRDFVISEDLPGFLNLVGIESPGLTAALAIGEHVARMLR